MGRKVGRPRQEGRERYPSGQVKPGVSPTLLARIRIEGMKRVMHPVIYAKIRSQIGRLSFTGQLTDVQSAAAFQIGDTYKHWNRYEQSKKAAKRPNYEQGSGGSADLAKECSSETERSVIEDDHRAAAAAWRAIDDILAGLPRNVRQAILDLCVHDLAINSLLLPEIRRFLDHLGRQWADKWRKQGEWRKQKGPIEPALRPTPMIVERAQAKPPHDYEVEAFRAVVRQLRPDLDAEGIVTLTDTFLAMRDRELFRAEKETVR
jgi:hypothetical protein